MENITKAIIQVMSSVKSIDKNLSVGEGRYSYNAVADKDVKQKVGNAMIEAGLCVVPIGIESDTTVTRWSEGNRQKQQILSEVTTKYRLLHISGEHIDFVGSGHGVDSQDKAAGKATTYALKYALLYLFMIPTGKIDDSDSNHSDDSAPSPVFLTEDQFKIAISSGSKGIAATLKKYTEQGYSISDAHKEALTNQLNKLNDGSK